MKKRWGNKKILAIAGVLICGYIVLRGFSVSLNFDMANPLISVKRSIGDWMIVSVNKVCTPVFEYVSNVDSEMSWVEKSFSSISPVYAYIDAKGEIEEINNTKTDEEDKESMAELENENARVSSEEDLEMANEEGLLEDDEKKPSKDDEETIDSTENDEQENNEQENDDSQSGDDEDIAQETIAKAGVVYSIEQLQDFNFLVNTLYTVDSSTSIDAQRLDVNTLLSEDLRIEQDNSVPQILIYHTHSQEAFVDSIEGDSSTSIVGVGRYLAQLLAEKYGYNVIHNSSSYDMIEGKLDRSYAFTLAEADVEKILQANPSIKVVIDLHRDGVNENVHFATKINEKNTAKIMFFNGLSYNNKVGDITYLNNPYIENNLAFSLQLQLKALEKYPDYVRKIYLKGYRYNLHLMPRATLVEAGGQTNTFEEVKNAMEPLAEILDEILNGS